MITIAIPTYQRGEIVVETIEQLLRLTPPAAEILIVDQTPSYRPDIDRRLHAHDARGDIRWIRLPRPSIPHAMNVALRSASQRVVLFLDDDIIPSARLVAEHERAHAEGVWAVVGQVLQPNEVSEHFAEAKLRGGVLRDLGFHFNHDEPCEIENVMAGNLSVDREKALAIGGFDENFIAGAYRFETDFARRVIAAGGRIRFSPRASIRHLHLATGGVRAHGDERRTTSASHSCGDYYFALWHVRPFLPYALRRLRSNVLTKWLLRHPWYIPARLIAEARGYALARRLYRRGRVFAE